MMTVNKKIWSSFPLIFLLLLLVLFFSLGLNKYLTFSSLKDHSNALITYTNNHFFLATLLFITIYSLAVAISIPGALFLTLAGGFLFGIVWGTLFVLFSATLGATLLFFAVRTAMGEWLAKRATSWVGRMREGFQESAFFYLLFLRLVPIFPFWAVNIVPAVLNVDAKTFIMATFIGIIPGTFVYVMAGNGLSHIFATNQTPNLGIIFDPQILIPLLALAALSLIPVIYKLCIHNKKGRPS
jgi:uncharacterized membrane protein YdjX (TVP38/TMEM64 family)